MNTRLAPGMFAIYNLVFAPEQNRDYEYEIKFITQKQTLTIPVIGIGPRPILDFPDMIVLPNTAVKIPSTKSLLVRNIGNGLAAFNISTSRYLFHLTFPNT